MSVENIGFPIPKRFDGKTSSVWNDYAQLYNEYKPISLGHGYADYVVTKYFNDVLAEVAANADNSMTQYTRAFVSYFYVNSEANGSFRAYLGILIPNTGIFN